MPDVVFSVSDFVGIFNQTLEYAYPSTSIVGEIANIRVSKNRWVYFDLKDEYATVKFFGTTTQMPGPIEDGMLMQVRGMPRLHPAYGFSVNVQFMSLVGEGSIKKSAAILEAKLRAEGLFDESRKRPLPLIPQKIALITSKESAAYHDFITILEKRWRELDIELLDVQVQGEVAASQIIGALEQFNNQPQVADIIVITRGGGSADDLAVFNNELLVRAIAASRIPTLVAVGHEVDITLAELAADRRASTPTNAAQLAVPDRTHALQTLQSARSQLSDLVTSNVHHARQRLQDYKQEIADSTLRLFSQQDDTLNQHKQLLAALDPQEILRRGYAIVRSGKKIIRSTKELTTGQQIAVQLSVGSVNAQVTDSTVQ